MRQLHPLPSFLALCHPPFALNARFLHGVPKPLKFAAGVDGIVLDIPLGCDCVF